MIRLDQETATPPEKGAVREEEWKMLSEHKPSATETVEQDAPACLHHWIIEPPQGPLSQGICQVCQEVREFKNSIAWEFRPREAGRPSSS
jgi:hypothetical protein